MSRKVAPFVRTVAVNAILAQTIHTTLATRYRGPAAQACGRS